jgi:tetratricopeptide (TPR) repeat protein
LLRRLDLSESPGSGVKSVDLKRVTPLLEASPSYLARPMKLLESHLAGERKFVLTTSPTAQAARWKAAHVADPRLWLKPFETLDRRSHLDWRALTMWFKDVLPLYCVYEERVAGSSKTSKDHLEYEESRTPKEAQVVEHPAALYKGRVLYLKGKFTGDEGAIRCFQIARPSYESLALSSADDIEKQVKLWAKQDASYWLGLIAYQRGNYPSAIDYFMTKTLEAFPNGPWSTGARYNLARTYEAAGKADTAVLLYRSNSASPGYHGDLLRAKWLRELSEKRKPESE